MTILEIVRYYDIYSFTFINPFLIVCYPSRRSSASWWTDTFGAEGDDSALQMNVKGFIQKPNIIYSSVSSYEDCIAQELSFFWDFDNQILYAHISQDILPDPTSFLVGVTSGFTNRGVAYIDDLLYKPLLKSIPSIAQQADLKEYSQLAFISGSIELDNTEGQFDDIIDDAIHGNDVFLYYLQSDPSRFRYTRSELDAISALYIENYRFSLPRFALDIQDKRKAANSKLLSLDADGKPIPLMYGPIRIAGAKVSDDTGIPVVYKLAPHMTNLGTVQCLGDFGWATVSPISYDLEAGTFTVSAIYARSPGNGLGEDTGSVLECRLLNPIGIANTSAADVIRDINQRILGIEYTSSNYDMGNWAIAEGKLAQIGVLFTSQMEAYAAIAKIQNNCNLGFRYDIDPEGKRRIIFDDWDAAAIKHISWADIKDNLTLGVKSDSTLLAGTIIVKYDRDYIDDAWLTYTDETAKEQVVSLYRQSPTLEVETYLLSEEAAQERASFAVRHFSRVLTTAEITLNGNQWYGLQIYDMIELELKTERRAYFGTWKAQVIEVDPSLDELETKISAVLIERI